MKFSGEAVWLFVASEFLGIKAKTTANNTQPSITRIERRGAKFGRISRAKAYGGCAGVGGDYANFSNQTRKAAKPSVASEISAHQVKREIAKGQVKQFSAS